MNTIGKCIQSSDTITSNFYTGNYFVPYFSKSVCQRLNSAEEIIFIGKELLLDTKILEVERGKYSACLFILAASIAY